MAEESKAVEQECEPLPPIPQPDSKPEEPQNNPEPESKNAIVAVGSVNRDSVLANVHKEKKKSLIRAWEESEKTKAENKASKQMSLIGSWENEQIAALEAAMKKIDEKIEKQRAEKTEKVKNKVAAIHKTAEERRALTEAKKGEELLTAEEFAAKYRATGNLPKKILGLF